MSDRILGPQSLSSFLVVFLQYQGPGRFRDHDRRAPHGAAQGRRRPPGHRLERRPYAAVYAWKHLRKHCPCAGCREEQQKPPDPFRILSAKDLAAPRRCGPRPSRRSATTPTRSPGTTATTPASTRSKTCGRCVSVRNAEPRPDRERGPYHGVHHASTARAGPQKIALPGVKHVDRRRQRQGRRRQIDRRRQPRPGPAHARPRASA